MTYNSVVISSGHGSKVPGACGILMEHEEAVRVVDRVAKMLRKQGVAVVTFEDTVSTTQNENLNRIVDFHNAQQRELDVSVHFNAYEQVTKPMGTECLYVTQSTLAGKISAAIASVGFINRGPKKRTDLFFLNETEAPSILIEVCFVDSEADAELYEAQFNAVCESVADVLGGGSGSVVPPPKPDATFHAVGTCSYFGGPDDDGVSPSEGLAFYSDIMEAPHLFLPYQPEGTSGLARRLNPFVHYVACRWDYDETPREMLKENVALVKSLKHGTFLTAFPADWGPNANTGRVADLSPGLLEDLGLETDDEVEVIFPWMED
jgi:N-acetylmuramoyl-L-alanine amidase